MTWARGWGLAASIALAFVIGLAAALATTGVMAQGNAWAHKTAYDACMTHKPDNANHCYNYGCDYKGCVASQTQSMGAEGFGIDDPQAGLIAAPYCRTFLRIQERCLKEYGAIMEPVEPPTATGGSFSCAAKDNEEQGCCCFRGAHTYLFAPRQVASVTATFDTGRGPNCESRVHVSVQTAPDVWEEIGFRPGNTSGSGGSDLAPHTESFEVGKEITGVQISDGCVCCLDDSSIVLN